MKKIDLREACLQEYGEEFVKQYDAVNEGIPVGDFAYTIDFLAKLEAVRDKLCKQKRKRRVKDG